MSAKSIISPIIALLFSGSLHAYETYYWDNQSGLTDASHCKIAAHDETNFRISEYYGTGKSITENLRNSKGVRQSYLRNGSLVKLIEGRGEKNFSAIHVIGVNYKNESELTQRWQSARGDEGFLFKQSLAALEDRIIQVKSQQDVKELNDSLWKIPRGESYLKLDCAEFEGSNRNYNLFEVFSPSDLSAPLAYIGVSEEETEIFNKIQTFTIDETQTLFPGLIDYELNIDDLEQEKSADESTAGSSLLTQDLELESGEGELHEEEGGEEDENADADEFVSGLNAVVCVPQTTLNVRDDSLENVLFQAKVGEKVKFFQGWEQNEKTQTIDNVEYEFVRVQFMDREEQDQNIGWVAKGYIKEESECAHLRVRAQVTRNSDTTITGLDDPNCCEFPTIARVTHAYTSGMRMFGARRGGGTRSHGATDLYRFRDEPILSVAPGTVVRDRYFFYQGTYAVEVAHSGGFIVRYGEINAKVPTNIKRGAKVKMGDRVGTMGVVNSGCCRPMLHFELYRGNGKGALTQTRKPYNRRSDLMNPTPYLLRWENEKFQ